MSNTWENIEAKVDKSSATPWEGCWIWTGILSNKGYGRISYQGKNIGVHVLFYKHYVGGIPKGWDIDHWCKNHACCRPGHLEAVTHQENILRGIGIAALNAKKTHCLNGHLLDGENLYIRPTGRGCFECNRKRASDFYHKNKTQK